MKLKYLLSLGLLVHFGYVILINMYPFHTLKHTKDIGDLSPIGAVCVDHIGDISIPIPVIHGVDFMANLTGSDRGYEFFSPNISRKNLQLTFVSDQGVSLQMLTSLEAEMKLYTAISYFNRRVGHQEQWHETLRSICQLFFVRNPTVKTIAVYATLSSFPEMATGTQSQTNIQTVLLSKVQRHDLKI